jgi:hypothetical protein
MLGNEVNVPEVFRAVHLLQLSPDGSCLYSFVAQYA